MAGGRKNTSPRLLDGRRLGTAYTFSDAPGPAGPRAQAQERTEWERATFFRQRMNSLRDSDRDTIGRSPWWGCLSHAAEHWGKGTLGQRWCRGQERSRHQALSAAAQKSTITRCVRHVPNAPGKDCKFGSGHTHAHALLTLMLRSSNLMSSRQS